MLVCSWQAIVPQQFDRIDKRRLRQFYGFLEISRGSIINGEEVVELADCWVELRDPKDIFFKFNLKDFIGQIFIFFLDRPFDS